MRHGDFDFLDVSALEIGVAFNEIKMVSDARILLNLSMPEDDKIFQRASKVIHSAKYLSGG